MCSLETEGIVSGYCEPAWECIRQLFLQNFAEQLDVGATLCVYHRNECVVDLTGGWLDSEDHAKPYQHNTLQIVYSTGKGIIATAVAICVQRGWLNYEESVAKYWPEFGQNGKQNIKIKDLLSHRAGLPVVDDDSLKLEDVYDGNVLRFSMSFISRRLFVQIQRKLYNFLSNRNPTGSLM